MILSNLQLESPNYVLLEKLTVHGLKDLPYVHICVSGFCGSNIFAPMMFFFIFGSAKRCHYNCSKLCFRQITFFLALYNIIDSGYP